MQIIFLLLVSPMLGSSDPPLPSNAVIRAVSFGDIPRICTVEHKCLCAAQTAHILETLVARKDFNFDLVGVLWEFGYDTQSNIRECLRGQLYFIRWALLMREDMTRFLFGLNQSLSLGIHPRETLLSSKLVDSHRRMNLCNIHRWYMSVLEPNVGKTFAETGLVSETVNAVKEESAIPVWRPANHAAADILQQEIDRYIKGAESYGNISRVRQALKRKSSENSHVQAIRRSRIITPSISSPVVAEVAAEITVIPSPHAVNATSDEEPHWLDVGWEFNYNAPHTWF